VAPKPAYAVHEKLERWGNPFAETPRSAPGPAPTGGQSDGRVALFVGDAGAHLGRPAVDAAMRLLAAAGSPVVPIGTGRSTGVLASSLGFPATAWALGRAVLDEIHTLACQHVLVLSPADRYAFERVYAERLNLSWPAGVAVKEVTTVLADAFAAGSLKLRPRESAPTYAYHDPCHAPRIDRTGVEARSLLTAVLGSASARSMFWREQRAHPCGAIGGLEFTFPELAGRLADARLADAGRAGASWLITEDPACLHHLRSRAGSGIEVVGLYELLAEQL
jgi:Fe-S oxidoreductase